jgi:LDH2 family malate/lactate/ureidoglycolate dehydrogenase
VRRGRAALRRALELVRDAGPLWAASLLADRLLPGGARALRAWPERRISAEALAGQVEAILLAWGMSAPHASTTAAHILWADLHGIDSHGCSMLRAYHRDLVSGALDPKATVSVAREGATTALVDGGGGLGHVPADTAMKLAIAKCLEAGVGAVAVRRSGHYGAAGCYAAMAAREGLLGFATTNTRAPAVIPTFGREARLGTHPIALAAPASRNPPFLLDMATSTASVGKLGVAWRMGRRVPRGWAVDPRGRAVTSPRRALRERRLTPLGSTPERGSHKGYGLAVAVEILSSVLGGARATLAPAAAEGGVGHFFLALDPRRFREAGEFESALDVLLDSLRSCPPLDPREPVRVAGDPEYATRAERESAGIPLPRAVLEDLRAMARASGTPFLLDGTA